MDKTELPLGFGMALAQNEDAMHRFEMLSDSEKRAVIEKAHSVNSKSEMASLVRSLTQNNTAE